MIATYTTDDYANRFFVVTDDDGREVARRRLGCPLDEATPEALDPKPQ
jgi:hypothetical protein